MLYVLDVHSQEAEVAGSGAVYNLGVNRANRDALSTGELLRCLDRHLQQASPLCRVALRLRACTGIGQQHIVCAH